MTKTGKEILEIVDKILKLPDAGDTATQMLIIAEQNPNYLLTYIDLKRNEIEILTRQILMVSMTMARMLSEYQETKMVNKNENENTL